ncbi:hypothetical protein [Dactylosporangium sp. CA-233914]|uniref:nucleotide-binding protein n=1 Tax=Dactylosporangium sp. CA-233914 TaxID=3239934 RepID=UPI003D8AA927
MKIAFVGKGGSGKTTLAGLFCRTLVAQGADVLAFDADINQHLAVALGADPRTAAGLPALAEHLEAIKEHLRGDNPRIASAAAMLKTTPPGRGSRILRPGEPGPVLAPLIRDVGGVRLAVTGPFGQDDLGGDTPSRPSTSTSATPWRGATPAPGRPDRPGRPGVHPRAGARRALSAEMGPLATLL